MDVTHDTSISVIAAAIGEPARARILSSLLDGHARTSTELAVIAGVGPSTASAHLRRLTTAHLIKVFVQGKHRYYSLNGPDVAHVLEGLNILAGAARNKFVPNTPNRLCVARTCYDHLAGRVGVSLHDRFRALGWLSPLTRDTRDYELTTTGTKAIEDLGIDLEETRSLRRRFAPACLDWSERRPHIGGALGAALLKSALKKRWLTRDLDSRALAVTGTGKREMYRRFGLNI
jgi:DNA-binding transcriptional ArsR family regulator